MKSAAAIATRNALGTPSALTPLCPIQSYTRSGEDAISPQSFPTEAWFLDVLLALIREELDIQRQSTLAALQPLVSDASLRMQQSQGEALGSSPSSPRGVLAGQLSNVSPATRPSDSKTNAPQSPRLSEFLTIAGSMMGGSMCSAPISEDQRPATKDQARPAKLSRTNTQESLLARISRYGRGFMPSELDRIPSSSSFFHAYKLRHGLTDTGLTRFVHSGKFRFVMSLVIIANALIIGIGTEQSVNYAFEHDRQAEQGMVELIEGVFTGIFTVEIILRIVAEQSKFLSGARRFWNIFDTVLVVQALMVGFFEVILGQAVVNMSFARVIRILRFARVIRLVRVIRLFRGFKIMVHSLAYSIFQLGWVFLMLLCVLYFFAVVILQGVATDVSKLHLDGQREDLKRLEENFGNLTKACISLFMVITGGKDWEELYLPLKRLNWIYGAILVFYIYFAFFGVLNVVTSVFVDATCQSAQTDPEIFIDNELDRNKMYKAQCMKFFLQADKELKGYLTREGFLSYLTDAKAGAFLSMLELDASQGEALYTLLDVDGENAVELPDFVEGCTRLRGGARSIDVNMLLYENEKMIGRWMDFMELMQARLGITTDATELDQVEEEEEEEEKEEPKERISHSADHHWGMLNASVMALDRIARKGTDASLTRSRRNSARISQGTPAHSAQSSQFFNINDALVNL